MSINVSKSNAVHFRPNAVPKTNFDFKRGLHSLLVMDKDTYLGITSNEFLDFNVTAKTVAQSASRALGLLIAKFKNMGGMPYDVYTKLYDAMVGPLISYGAAIWGAKSFSCINAMQRVCRAMEVYQYLLAQND